MSFGVGIGDVITVVLMVQDIAETCMNSSQHVKDTWIKLGDSSVMLSKLGPLTEAYFRQHPEDDLL